MIIILGHKNNEECHFLETPNNLTNSRFSENSMS
jgi:hypothetical protein